MEQPRAAAAQAVFDFEAVPDWLILLFVRAFLARSLLGWVRRVGGGRAFLDNSCPFLFSGFLAGLILAVAVGVGVGRGRGGDSSVNIHVEHLSAIILQVCL